MSTQTEELVMFALFLIVLLFEMPLLLLFVCVFFCSSIHTYSTGDFKPNVGWIHSTHYISDTEGEHGEKF